MIGRNESCWCGSEKKWKHCHFPQKKGLDKLFSGNAFKQQYGITLKTPEQVKGIRVAGHLAAHILTETCKLARAGITTQELNDFAHRLHLEAGATPAPLHYGSPPFPASICTSLNDVICHGIPDSIPLKDGDILNIDVTCIKEGFYGDCSRMVTIGPISDDKKHVVDVSYDCLMLAIKNLEPNRPLCIIGDTIEAHAHSHHCSVVHQFVAHGVGLDFHEPPHIPHYHNTNQTPLTPGMTFTIEPMINAGVAEGTVDKNNGWTCRTNDQKPSAQWEHTLLITETGCEILTPWER